MANDVTNNVIHDYRVVERIGGGQYGDVFLAVHKDEGVEYALKIINLRLSSENEREKAFEEVKLMSRLKHPHLVEFKESFQSRDFKLCIAMELCNGGDMSNFLESRQGMLLPEDQIVKWLGQIAAALYYLHGENILHRDLKCKNIFLTMDYAIKLGDLGIARVLESSIDKANTYIGSPYYMSPEIFSCHPYDCKTDIWSLGCCVYEMMTLRYAFEAANFPALIFKVMKGKVPSLPPKYSNALSCLVHTMLKKDAAKRPTAERILKHNLVARATPELTLVIPSEPATKKKKRTHRLPNSSTPHDEAVLVEGKSKFYVPRQRPLPPPLVTSDSEPSVAASRNKRRQPKKAKPTTAEASASCFDNDSSVTVKKSKNMSSALLGNKHEKKSSSSKAGKSESSSKMCTNNDSNKGLSPTRKNFKSSDVSTDSESNITEKKKRKVLLRKRSRKVAKNKAEVQQKPVTHVGSGSDGPSSCDREDNSSDNGESSVSSSWSSSSLLEEIPVDTVVQCKPSPGTLKYISDSDEISDQFNDLKVAPKKSKVMENNNKHVTNSSSKSDHRWVAQSQRVRRSQEHTAHSQKYNSQDWNAHSPDNNMQSPESTEQSQSQGYNTYSVSKDNNMNNFIGAESVYDNCHKNLESAEEGKRHLDSNRMRLKQYYRDDANDDSSLMKQPYNDVLVQPSSSNRSRLFDDSTSDSSVEEARKVAINVASAVREKAKRKVMEGESRKKLHSIGKAAKSENSVQERNNKQANGRVPQSLPINNSGAKYLKQSGSIEVSDHPLSPENEHDPFSHNLNAPQEKDSQPTQRRKILLSELRTPSPEKLPSPLSSSNFETIPNGAFEGSLTSTLQNAITLNLDQQMAKFTPNLSKREERRARKSASEQQSKSSNIPRLMDSINPKAAASAFSADEDSTIEGIMLEKIRTLQSDCVAEIGEDLFLKAYQTLEDDDENEIVDGLITLLGAEKYQAVWAKIMHLKLCEDTMSKSWVTQC